MAAVRKILALLASWVGLKASSIAKSCRSFLFPGLLSGPSEGVLPQAILCARVSFFVVALIAGARLWQELRQVNALYGTRRLALHDSENTSDVSDLEGRAKLKLALKLLEKTQSGKELLSRAKKQWGLKSDQDVLDKLRLGTVSKTDAILTRLLDPSTGRETRQREITIYLRQSQQLLDTVLDLAHELTHAVFGPSWDPYDPRLTPGRYIWASLESSGGEVDALTWECRVGMELYREIPELSVHRCLRYLSEDGLHIDRGKILADFYRVGSYKSELERRLGKETPSLPLLSSDKPELFSSTWNDPYPVALYKEFRTLTKMACENSNKRLENLRQPASSASRDFQSLRQKTEEFVQKRCGVEISGF